MKYESTKLFDIRCIHVKADVKQVILQQGKVNSKKTIMMNFLRNYITFCCGVHFLMTVGALSTLGNSNLRKARVIKDFEHIIFKNEFAKFCNLTTIIHFRKCMATSEFLMLILFINLLTICHKQLSLTHHLYNFCVAFEHVSNFVMWVFRCIVGQICAKFHFLLKAPYLQDV